MSVAGELIRLRKAPLSALQARYLELTGEELKARDREDAWRSVARAIQGQGPPPEVAPVVTATIAAPAARPRRHTSASKRASSKVGRPLVGTVLVRVWHGVEHRITIVEGGYSLDGVAFKTASALARHVTGGQHWNGRLWLGLKKRGKKVKR